MYSIQAAFYWVSNLTMWYVITNGSVHSSTDRISIAVGAVDVSSITISWTVIITANITPTNYTISYSNANNALCFTSFMTLFIHGSAASHTIVHLEEATEYSFTVTASYDGGSISYRMAAATLPAGKKIQMFAYSKFWCVTLQWGSLVPTLSPYVHVVVQGQMHVQGGEPGNEVSNEVVDQCRNACQITNLSPTDLVTSWILSKNSTYSKQQIKETLATCSDCSCKLSKPDEQWHTKPSGHVVASARH